MRILVIAFDDTGAARSAAAALRTINIPPERIHVEYGGPSDEEQAASAAVLHNLSASVFTPIVEYPSRQPRGLLAESKARSILRVDTIDSSQANTIRAMLQRFGPADIKEAGP